MLFGIQQLTTSHSSIYNFSNHTLPLKHNDSVIYTTLELPTSSEREDNVHTEDKDQKDLQPREYK